MKELIIILSQVSLLVLCAYVVYKALFARDAFHSVKRFVILFLVAISFALPLCRITIHKVAVENPTTQALANNVNLVDDLTHAEWQVILGQESSFDWFLLIGTVYLAGVAALLAYRFIGIRRVNAIIKNSTRKYIHNGIEVLLVSENIPAFSYRNKIVMPCSDFDDNSEMIISHELVHIKQRHSADLGFINLALSLQWFNPFIWLLRRELILTHEFSADQGVINSGIDAKKYQYLLISKSAGSHDFIPVVNHLRSSNLHKRIKTMKRKSSKLALLKLLIVLPLICVALVAFAKTEYITKQEAVTAAEEKFCMPYQGRIMGKYGKQIDPVSKGERIHIGVDIMVTNDTVRAPLGGVVKYADFPQDGYGNKLVITHANDLETTYAHLAKFLVSEGTTVKAGDPIAIVGSTGRATGKHLHLECRVNGELVDPQTALPLSK